MAKKKTAVVGAGWFGRAHIRVYNGISDLQAIVDTNEEQAKTVAESYNINYYLNYSDMIKNEDLDAVSVVLPPRMIPIVGDDFANEGIDVLLEKPLGINMEDIQKLVKYTSDVRLTCGFIECFNPVVERLKKRLPEIGTPIMISSRRIGRMPRRFWNLGVLLDLGIHEISVQRLLFGEVTKIKSTLSYFHKEDYEDAAFILLKFSRNVQGLIEVNWLTPTKYRKLNVYGSEGVMEIDYITQELKLIRSSEEPEFYRIEESKQPYVWEEPLQRELKAFLYDKNNPFSLEEGIKNLEIALQCLKQD
ncbi:MAG: Gfo/Idh/MocA family oxidoreductase [Candidatus Helarchaeota archaeon]|nr:Gfo/Idh/MocA family oxidoreductase [Candidatus Helarchaeota archaeon]